MSFKTSLLKWMDTAVGGPLCRTAGTVDHFTRRNASFPAPVQADTVSRILVVRPGGMGDMVMLLPVLASLGEHFPAARLSVVCEKRNLAILGLARSAADVFAYDREPLRVLHGLHSTRYDIAIDTEQFHHFSALFAYWSRAPVRVGFKINPTRNALYTHLVNYAPDGPEGEQFLNLLSPLGIPRAPYRLQGTLREKIVPDNEFVQSVAGGTDPYCVFHPGTSNAYKLWDTARYTELARLLKKHHGLRFIITGSRGERDIADRVAGMIRDGGIEATSIAGHASLLQAVSVIRGARLFVGPDSGMGHLTVAVGVPTVILFGPSDSDKWGATGGTHAVVNGRAPCAPCFIFGYHKPCHRLDCMKVITAAAVFDACERVLATAGQ